MCYGLCPYEGYWGQCTLQGEDYPEDAACMSDNDKDNGREMRSEQ